MDTEQEIGKPTIFEQVAKILEGIDSEEQESGYGWWETSYGAQFGAEKLEELRVLLTKD